MTTPWPSDSPLHRILESTGSKTNFSLPLPPKARSSGPDEQALQKALCLQLMQTLMLSMRKLLSLSFCLPNKHHHGNT